MALAAAGLMFASALPANAQVPMPFIEASAILAPDLGCGTALAALLGQTAARRPKTQLLSRHRTESEPPPTLRHAYYTCTRTPLNAMPIGAGWLAVGPIRRG
jgi:hypothetical protein